jgi:hypothetical protein
MDVMAAIASVSEMEDVVLLLLNCLNNTVACAFVDCCSALRHKSVSESW